MKSLLSKFPFVLMKKSTLAELKKREERRRRHCHILATDPFGPKEEDQQADIKRKYLMQALIIRTNDVQINPYCRYPYRERDRAHYTDGFASQAV